MSNVSDRVFVRFGITQGLIGPGEEIDALQVALAVPPFYRFGGRKRFDTRPGIIPDAVRRMRATGRREWGGTPVPWLDDASFAFPSFAQYRNRPYDQEIDDQ